MHNVKIYIRALLLLVRHGRDAAAILLEHEKIMATINTMVRPSQVEEIRQHIRAGRLSITDVMYGIHTPADRAQEHTAAILYRESERTWGGV